MKPRPSKKQKHTKHSQRQPTNVFKSTPAIKAQNRLQAKQRPPIPFEANDDVLLVGEGDFSFAHCLLQHHSTRWRTMTATTLDTRETLVEKHPQSAAYINAFLTAEYPSLPDPDGDEDEDEEYPPLHNEESPPPPQSLTSQPPSNTAPRCKIHYSIDATTLSRSPLIRKNKYTKIVFNFPHVGGKSTDVNRQVRYNQQMLHAFLVECKSLLIPPAGSVAGMRYHDSHSKGMANERGGSVLITLFEGSPYTLWNVRDLARSAGLECRRSWRFEWADWKGYEHARTLGNLKVRDRKDDQEGERAKRKGKAGWKGEGREARTYEFGLKVVVPLTGGRGKRNRDGESSDEDRE